MGAAWQEAIWIFEAMPTVYKSNRANSIPQSFFYISNNEKSVSTIVLVNMLQMLITPCIIQTDIHFILFANHLEPGSQPPHRSFPIHSV